jgi:hypothetical protein
MMLQALAIERAAATRTGERVLHYHIAQYHVSARLSATEWHPATSHSAIASSCAGDLRPSCARLGYDEDRSRMPAIWRPETSDYASNRGAPPEATFCPASSAQSQQLRQPTAMRPASALIRRPARRRWSADYLGLSFHGLVLVVPCRRWLAVGQHLCC